MRLPRASPVDAPKERFSTPGAFIVGESVPKKRGTAARKDETLLPPGAGPEIAVNTCLHIFLLSFFVVTFYYLRAAPQERTGYLSKAARIPDDVADTMAEIAARAEAIAMAVEEKAEA